MKTRERESTNRVKFSTTSKTPIESGRMILSAHCRPGVRTRSKENLVFNIRASRPDSLGVCVSVDPRWRGAMYARVTCSPSQPSCQACWLFMRASTDVAQGKVVNDDCI